MQMQEIQVGLLIVGLFQSAVMTLGLFILKDLRDRMITLETRQIQHAERISKLEGNV